MRNTQFFSKVCELYQFPSPPVKLTVTFAAYHIILPILYVVWAAHKQRQARIATNRQNNKLTGFEAGNLKNSSKNEANPLLAQNLSHELPAQQNASSTCKSLSSSTEEGKALKQLGFSRSPWGGFLFFLLNAAAFFTQLLLLSLTFNEMCVAVETAHYFWDERAASFCILWSLGICLFWALSNTSSSSSTFFLKSDSLEACQFVLIVKPEESVRTQDISGLSNSSGNSQSFWKNFNRQMELFESYWLELTRRGNRHHLIPVESSSEGGNRYFEFECVRYVYSAEEGVFTDMSYRIKTPLQFILSSISQVGPAGLSKKDVQRNLSLVGPNVINMQIPSLYQSIMDEFLGKGFIVQLFLVWSQLFWRNYVSTLIWGGLAVFSIAQKVCVNRRNQLEIRKIASSANYQRISVFRGGEFQEITVSQLVPGDIVSLSSDMEYVPCDIAILLGEALLDESSLTGETVLCEKLGALTGWKPSLSLGGANYESLIIGNSRSSESVRNHLLSRLGYDGVLNKQQILYAGSRIVSLNRSKGCSSSPSNTHSPYEGAEAISTANARLLDILTFIASGLELKYNDEDDEVEGGLRAVMKARKIKKESSSSSSHKPYLIGVAISTGVNTQKGKLLKDLIYRNPIVFKYDQQLPVVFVLLCTYSAFCIAAQIFLLGFSPATFFYSVGTISQVTPIWISVILYIGQSVASQRLERENSICCLDSSRIAICGKIRVFCFDKTGTLTKDEKKFAGFLPCEHLADPMKLFFTKVVENFEGIPLHTAGKSGYECVLNSSEDLSSASCERLTEVCLATCNSLVFIEKQGLMLGGELDKTLFAVSRCYRLRHAHTLDAGSFRVVYRSIPGHSELKAYMILKSFKFDYELQTESVIVCAVNNAKEASIGDSTHYDYLTSSTTVAAYLFTKGSVSRLQDKCITPSDCSLIAENYSRLGYYVLACAYKPLGVMTISSAQELQRDDVEKNLMFLSLILLHNEVKEDARESIALLKEGKVRPVVLTGDNPFTSYFVGNQCRLFERYDKVTFSSKEKKASKASKPAITSFEGTLPFPYMEYTSNTHTNSDYAAVDYTSPVLLGSLDEKGNMMWQDIMTKEMIGCDQVLYEKEFRELIVTTDLFGFLFRNFERILKDAGMSSSEEVRGSALDKMQSAQFREHDIKAEAPYKEDSMMSLAVLENLVMRIRIFAQMNPQDKSNAMKIFVALGYITGMCGDGGNDCGALRTAHAGISLSNAESSVVSPFTSKSKAVRSVPDLVREGRGSLVTSLACYKFMILFGLLVSVVKLSLFAFVHATMPELGHLCIDCLILLGLSQAMTLSRPKLRLSIRSPTSSILGGKTVLSLVAIAAVDVCFLFLILNQLKNLGLESHYEYNKSFPIYAWWMKSDNMEAPCIWMWLSFQLITAALIFSFGGLFRRSVYRNVPLTIWSIVLCFCLVFLVVSPPNIITCLFRINCTDEISRTMNLPILRIFSITANGMPFWGEGGSNVLPSYWKVQLLLLNIANSVINILIAHYIIFGTPARYLRSITKSRNSADYLNV